MPNTSTGPFTPPPGCVPGRPPSRVDAPAVSRLTTDALKGVAILGVLLSHYVYHEIGNQPMLVSALNGYLGLFFVISGLGIEASLERRLAQGVTFPAVGRFYLERALRIYPAYYLGLWTMVAISGKPYGLAAYTGYISPYWFITSILHCYAAAPLFHSMLGRLGPGRFTALVTLAALGLNLVYQVWLPPLDEPWLSLVVYKNILLGHLLFFAWGMAMYRTRKTAVDAPQNTLSSASGLRGWVAFVLCLPFAGLLASTTLSPLVKAVSAVLYYLMLLATARAAFEGRLPLPTKRLLCAIGRATLLIYLFEPYYYFFVGARILTPGALSTPFLYALTLSVFILLCIVAQPAFDLLARLPFRLRPRS
ncbi:acyltransferase [Desulfovibrio sulfodismutans]|uniref:Acyltransferase n=1 Tax=Desulfolutivibrio sulfodismutans TaxID=63561 RepID=A0A7K3NPC6_9BACT|nr:acyltransferase family protein [Desulfolutivibrio sulfodismutans]NDY58046.1 acyltransferase [Desulfolutivibrio sulfodismutans]QLA11845.1 acyltransferase family protein [Desulfolutivibrio sulfodismutans DSM 3696]